ncbi:hypothetical protein H1C71_021152, partial [Ictidomys tridecemlineatus]
MGGASAAPWHWRAPVEASQVVELLNKRLTWSQQRLRPLHLGQLGRHPGPLLGTWPRTRVGEGFSQGPAPTSLPAAPEVPGSHGRGQRENRQAALSHGLSYKPARLVMG